MRSRMRDLVGLSADLLHDQPEHVVVSVGVLEHLAGDDVRLSASLRAATRSLRAPSLMSLLSMGSNAVLSGRPLVWLSRWRTVIVADADSSPTLKEGRYVTTGRVEIHLPVLDQLHDRQGREGLGRGSEDERGLRRDGAPGSISHPEALKVHYLVVVHDAESQAGDAHARASPGQGRRRLRRSRDWRQVADRRRTAQSGPCTGPP